ncbi:DUF4838 domain-containing protein [Sphingobacterium sp. HJSM2_6]|uniref:DUF4838 domain-containing protein n=1 Tax=Sphingobacterium sp. HJSM2_6 TaxID=3366264 RepID=UPI003BD5D51B
MKSGKSDYVILLPSKDRYAEKAAVILQSYIRKSTDFELPIHHTKTSKQPSIIFSNTANPALKDEFHISVQGKNIHIKASGETILFATYQLIENLLGARKWYIGEEGTHIPKHQQLSLPSTFHLSAKPSFDFREVYFPTELDEEYLDWHGLHNLEKLWGLWGHSFNKLIPAAEYFQEHPEYFSYYRGKRQPNQLCLSNPAVFQLVKDKFQHLIADQPDATYWSISPNDDLGYCECDECKAIDQEEGGPQGSLMRFVNQVAQEFPKQKFTTLAYTYSANPPLKEKALPNVYVMLSSIDAYRSNPLSKEPSAQAFRSQLNRWKEKASHIFVWDYYTQFTNYLAPFPQWGTIGDNIRYFKNNQVQGVFAQGSGHTYSDFAELKAYLLAKLLWNPDLKEEDLIAEFVQGYYGKAAQEILRYIKTIREDLISKQAKLDIYGNPIDNHRDFLSPEAIDLYSSILDRAEDAVADNPLFAKRIAKIRLSFEYVVFQQAKFFGIDKHGIYDFEEGQWKVKPKFEEKLQRFIHSLNTSDIKELSEDGMTDSLYAAEWRKILQSEVRPNLAAKAHVTLAHPFVPDFPAKGLKTLIDQNPGYLDFSYNWLIFNGKPLDATIHFDKAEEIQYIETQFLDDARHWIFKPRRVRFFISKDAVNFEEVLSQTIPDLDEDYEKGKFTVKLNLEKQVVKSIRILAEPFDQLPEWRFHPNKKPNLAIDEIWVQ